jgi:predicted HTH transcriptional regulator
VKLILIVDDFYQKQNAKRPPKVTLAEVEGKQAVILEFEDSVFTQKPDFFPQYARLGLNERQRRAFSYLQQSKVISNKEYRKISAGINTETARLDLHKMVKVGLLEKKGSKKGTLYCLKEKK